MNEAEAAPKSRRCASSTRDVVDASRATVSNVHVHRHIHGNTIWLRERETAAQSRSRSIRKGDIHCRISGVCSVDITSRIDRDTKRLNETASERCRRLCAAHAHKREEEGSDSQRRHGGLLVRGLLVVFWWAFACSTRVVAREGASERERETAELISGVSRGRVVQGAGGQSKASLPVQPIRLVRPGVHRSHQRLTSPDKPALHNRARGKPCEAESTPGVAAYGAAARWGGARQNGPACRGEHPSSPKV